MSNIIPKSAGLDSFFFIMVIRVWESDKTVSDLTFDAAAVMTAQRIAKASAIKADEIQEWDLQIVVSDDMSVPVKMPPNPQSPVVGHHAAST